MRLNLLRHSRKRWASALQLIAAALAGLLFTAPSFAHEGHVHGEQPAAIPMTAAPRLVLQSELHQLVGILKDGDLKLFLDRTADNAPVTDAKLTLSFGATNIEAKPLGDGTYLIEGGPLRTPARHEIIAAITGGAGDDLLIGTFDLSVPAQPQPAISTASRSDFAPPGLPAWVYGAMIFVAGLIVGALLRGGRSTGAAILLLAMLPAVSALPADAHEGHDHGGGKAPPAALTGDVPRRLEDGSLFVPKPTQRLLELRTMRAAVRSAQPAVRLFGRVIADPNRSALIQSVNGGRIMPADGGVPKLGQTVRKGDVLAEVEPPLATGDYSSLADRAGEIAQQIALAEAKIARLERLVSTNAASTAQLEDARLELRGLELRRAAIRSTQREREVLRAPVDGVIAASRVVPGQVVEARDVLLQIVDPASHWVEALAFDPRNAEGLTGGEAVLEDGKALKLRLEGKGRALQQHAMQLQFAVESPPANLSIGLPVTVLAARAEAVSGIIVAREAVVRGTNGESVVFEHMEPERFVARIVRPEPVDGSLTLIRAGIEPGARIVVRGAELLGQIR